MTTEIFSPSVFQKCLTMKQRELTALKSRRSLSSLSGALMLTLVILLVSAQTYMHTAQLPLKYS